MGSEWPRTDRSVEDEDGHVGFDGLLNLHHLVKQFALLTMSARRVDNDDVEAFGAELLNALERDGHRVGFSVTARARVERSISRKEMSMWRFS